MISSLFIAVALAGQPVGAAPVLVGLDLEAGHLTSTSDDAIRLGARLAAEEVNRRGGVLGGRPLELLERDNRSNPARGVENLRELAAISDLVAVLGGKFSPVLLEELPVVRELELPLLDPWASADAIVDGRPGGFVFRLSLKDGWAMPALLREAEARGLKRVGLLLASTAWGRSNERVAVTWAGQQRRLAVVEAQWFNMGDKTLLPKYLALRAAGAEAVILVANEVEGSILIREVAALPSAERLPLLSHWGITGGDFPALCGAALHRVDLVVVQTFSFEARRTALAAAVLEAARHAPGAEQALRSPVGLAHAYDLVQILARAVDLAGSTDRRKVRDALEQVRYGDGLVRHYGQPFSPTRHEALGPEDVFLARWNAVGALVPVR